MNPKLNTIRELLEELENWLYLMNSLEKELEPQDTDVPNNEGLEGLIEILEAARAKAEQEELRYEMLFEESVPEDYVSWFAALPDSFEFLWKARGRS